MTQTPRLSPNSLILASMKGDSAKPPTMKMNYDISWYQARMNVLDSYLNVDVSVLKCLVELLP